MTTKASNSVLNLTNPPIDELLLATPLVVPSGGTGVNNIPKDAIITGNDEGPFTWIPVPVIGLKPSIRYRITENTDYFCNFTIPDGDTTGDGTSTNPFQTLQHTWDWIANNIDSSGFIIRIWQVDGVDRYGLVTSSIVGVFDQTIVIINGGIDTTGQSWQGTARLAGIECNHGTLRVSSQTNATITGTNWDLNSAGEGIINFDGCTVGPCTQGKFSGNINIVGDYTDGGGNVTSDFTSHWEAVFAQIYLFRNGTRPDGDRTLANYPNNGTKNYVSLDANTITITSSVVGGIAVYAFGYARAELNGVVRCDEAFFVGSPNANGNAYAISSGGGIFRNQAFAPPIPPIVASGSFVVGQKYQITTVGTTDFVTEQSATSNTPGVVFVALVVGTGSGTANPFYSDNTGWYI